MLLKDSFLPFLQIFGLDLNLNGLNLFKIKIEILSNILDGYIRIENIFIIFVLSTLKHFFLLKNAQPFQLEVEKIGICLENIFFVTFFISMIEILIKNNRVVWWFEPKLGLYSIDNGGNLHSFTWVGLEMFWHLNCYFTFRN